MRVQSRKWAMVLLALLVSSVTALDPDLAAASSCNRLGQIRSQSRPPQQFRCVRVKGRLQWVRLKNVSATTSSTTSTTVVPTDQIAREIHDVVVLGQSQKRTASSEFVHVVEPTISSSQYVEQAKADAGRAGLFFDALGFSLPRRVIVFYSVTGDWLRYEADSRGCFQRPAAGVDWKTDQFALGGYAIPGYCNDGSVVVIAGDPQRWGRIGTLNFHHVLPHELFHQWQMTNASNCGPWICGNADFPRWFFEGTAQLMTRLVFASWNTSRNVQQWHDYWYDVERRDMRSMCEGVGIQMMENVSEPWPGTSWCAYSKGQIAIELLIANYGGLENLRRLLTEKTTTGTSTFPAHFKRITGRDLNEFYEEVDRYLLVRGWK
jgi:hypothetical protein